MRLTCAYLNCQNSRQNCDFSFFGFPADPNLCNIWLINCGNFDLINVDENKLKNYVVCSQHFTPISFVNSQLKRLNKNAVPVSYKDDTIHLNFNADNVKRTYAKTKSLTAYDNSVVELPPSPILKEILDMPSTSKACRISKASENKCKRHLLIIKKLRMNINRLNKKVESLQNKLKKRKLCIKSKEMPSSSNVSTFKQLLNKNRKRVYTTKEKKLALSIYYKSSGCYKFMRNYLKIPLPSQSTIWNWLKNF